MMYFDTYWLYYEPILNEVVMFRHYLETNELVKLLGNDDNIFISLTGKVINKNGDYLESKIDDEGYRTVYLKSFDGLRDYRVVDLMAIQFKSINIPFEELNRVIGFYIDGNKQNQHANNIGYRFKNGPVESFKPGFFYIPTFTNYLINKKGDVFSIKKEVYKKYITSKPRGSIKGGYRIAAMINDVGQRFTFGRHRLLLLTFSDYPDNCDKLVVNHINGIPGDDRLENLEWCTRGQNNLHAYKNDLKNQHKRVLVRNARTGEVIEYYSISEAARLLGLACDEAMRHRLLKSSFGKIFSDGTQCKFKDDSRDWIIHDDVEYEIWKMTYKPDVLTLNCNTGEEVIYSDVDEFGRVIGISGEGVKCYLRTDKIGYHSGYQFQLNYDVAEWLPFDHPRIVNAKKAFIPIDGWDLKTNEVYHFDSISDACRQYGLKDRRIAENLRSNLFCTIEEGVVFKYKETEWCDEDVAHRLWRRAKRVITAREVATGNIVIANSATEMGELLDLDRKRIRKAAEVNGNLNYHGFQFMFGTGKLDWPVIQS